MGKRIDNVKNVKVQLLFKGSQMDFGNAESHQRVKTLTLELNANVTANWFKWQIPPVDTIGSKTRAATTLPHKGASGKVP